MNQRFDFSTALPVRACIASFVLFSGGCEQDFDPRGPLDKQMVVFSVLSTDRNMQLVRVQKAYASADFNPLSNTSDNSLNDVTVALNASNGTYFFTDTLLPRQDNSRYTFPIHAFVLSRFTPSHGSTYQIVVQSKSYGMASATVTIPGTSEITMASGVEQVLKRPEGYSQDFPLTFAVQLSPDAKGCLSRLLLYYDVLKGKRWFEERVEVPITSVDSTNYSLDYPAYPQLTALPSTSHVGLYYKNGYYKAIVNVVNSRYSSNRIVFKWVTLVVLQADRNLAQYYTNVHPSFDPYSIRLDEPIVSTVSGSLGFVGGYNLDSLVQLLPGNFWGNR